MLKSANLNSFLKLLAITVILTLIIVPILYGKTTTEWMFANTSYWVLSLTFLWWLKLIVQKIIEKKKWLLENWAPLLTLLFFAIFIVSAIFLTIDKGFKTNSDEANLLSVSRSLLYSHKPFNITEGIFYYDSFNPIAYEIPIRPIGFPYLLQLFHLIFGFGLFSALALNFVFSVILIFIIAFPWWKKQLYSYGIISILLLISNGIFSVAATSAGFDIASITLLSLSIYMGYEYLKKPSDRVLFRLFVSTLLVFSHIRYENPLIAIILILLIIFRTKTIKRTLNEPIFYLIPLSLGLHLWQRFLTIAEFQRFYRGPTLSLGFFPENINALFNSFTNTELLNNNILVFIGSVCLLLSVFIGILFYKLKERWTILIISIPFFIQTFIILIHYGSLIYFPTQTRYFLPLFVFSSFAGTYLFYRLRLFIPPLLAVTLSFFMALFFLPKAAEGRVMNSLILNRDLKILKNLFAEQSSKRFVVVYERPVEFTAFGIGAISPDTAHHLIEQLQLDLKTGLFDSIFFVEFAKFGDENKTWASTIPQTKVVKIYRQVDDTVGVIRELKRID